jgi:hypothetical protein
MKIYSYVIVGFLAVSFSAASSAFKQIDLGVSAYMDGGRFQLDDPDLVRNGEYLSRAGARWTIKGNFTEKMSAFTNLHWLWWRNQAMDLGLFHVAGIKFDSDLEASLEYRPGDSHRLRVGLYEFKYNPDSKNLGEYLLRCEAYPTILENSQGVDILRPSHARTAGLQYDLALGHFHQTVLVYLEQTNIPVNDMSLAYFAAVRPAGLEVAAGIAHRRFFAFGNRVNNTLLPDTLGRYIEEQGLTTEATSVMLRGHVDFNTLLGLSFEEGFKLYGEAAVLGFKDDTLYYPSLFQRAPLMLGVDIPTGGVLNLLSLEVERLKNPYYDKKYSLADHGGSKFSPLPSLNSEDEYLRELPAYHRDDWKWSLYLVKSLNKWVDLKIRAANDHLRLLGWDKSIANGGRPITYDSRWNSWNSIPYPKDWYFLIRIEWHN